MIRSLLPRSAAFLASFAIAGAAFAEPVFPPGAAVGLEPPPGMTFSKTFSGFADEKSGASIVIIEFPLEAHTEIAAQFTPEGLRRSGFEAAAPAEDVTVGGASAKLMRGSQTARGTVFRKWVMLARSPSGTAMITAQVPEAALGAIPEPRMEAALRSIAFRPPAGIEEKIGALPFVIADRAGFRPSSVLAGSGLILTDGPLDVVQDNSQPVIVIGSSFAPAPPNEPRAAFAKRAFGTIGSLASIAAKREDLQGDVSVIEGDGIDPKTNQTIYVMQTIRFTGQNYVRIIAMSRESEQARFSARFSKLSQSVRGK